MGPKRIVLAVLVASAIASAQPAIAATISANGQIALVSFPDGTRIAFVSDRNDPASDGTLVAFQMQTTRRSSRPTRRDRFVPSDA